MTQKKSNKAKRLRRAKARNPFALLTRRRGHGVERSAKLYRRRAKHQKPPSENGGSSCRAATSSLRAGGSRHSNPERPSVRLQTGLLRCARNDDPCGPARQSRSLTLT